MISVVVPALNEARALTRTLAHLLEQSGAYEVIVVDGGSEDSTLEIARSFTSVRAVSAPRGRAMQMNAGARLASGELLLFLHADTLLPDGALARLNALESDHAYQAGGFRHRFAGDDWRLRTISRLDNFRCRRTGIIYGDQAMFVRRNLFWQLGGFPDTPILEDVMFCEKLTRVARPQLIDQEAITDARKFVQMGPWRSLVRCCAILVAYQLRLPIPARNFFDNVR